MSLHLFTERSSPPTDRPYPFMDGVASRERPRESGSGAPANFRPQREDTMDSWETITSTYHVSSPVRPTLLERQDTEASGWETISSQSISTVSAWSSAEYSGTDEEDKDYDEDEDDGNGSGGDSGGDDSAGELAPSLSSVSDRTSDSEISSTTAKPEHKSRKIATRDPAVRDVLGGEWGTFPDLTTLNTADSSPYVAGFRDGVTLLPHQVTGRQWMKQKEATRAQSGGILADYMGLGKTIQVLVRIVDDKMSQERAEGPTLIVCPLAVMGQWAAEINSKTKDITVLEHHGAGRATDAGSLLRFDVILTTFGDLASEHRSSLVVDVNLPHQGTVHRALFQVRWRRVVLDEAHNIKRRTTKAAQACFALDSEFRWCLTGTPVQNTVEELYSYIKFLRASPFDSWEYFNRYILLPLKGRDPQGGLHQIHIFLAAFMLRRDKGSVILPERIVRLEACYFNETERDQYRKLETRLEKEVKRALDANTYGTVLTSLLRLRQGDIPFTFDHHPILESSAACCHFSIGPQSCEDDDDDSTQYDAVTAVRTVVRYLCDECLCELSHDGLCEDCALVAPPAPVSALSTASVTSSPHAPSVTPSPDVDSTKLRKMVEILRKIQNRPVSAQKTVIFSQFLPMLDLIQNRLESEDLSFVRYDGQMSKAQRDTSLRRIAADPSIKCLVISFKSGGTGLNLTACANLILMDPWWNPALEEQAFDRIHRVGQTQVVQIYKLIVRQTIEDRVVQLQARKQRIAHDTLGLGTVKALRELRKEDIVALFRTS
ncbi:hypothetical protein BV25DRAFT_1922398 [Artomyces pyxidatus]|uniref:Uncharacterized protein n=1 Tax=Artomyces pyxidatus TaxID=48021 RepID=A0ACB8SET8_9AGAM|nr:hypothetical protein BV25DRAFT_1922398 [Artomyces pyxidatus]